jgi:diguanylate cyclase (GGDEF)-like protein
MQREKFNFNQTAQFVGKAVIVGLLYIAAERIGCLFSCVDSPPPVIRPQAGIAFVATLLAGYSTLPGIMLGAVVAALINGTPFLMSLFYGVGDLLAAYMSVNFIRQQVSFSNDLKDYRSVFSFLLFGVVVGPIISASISIAGMYLLEAETVTDMPALWSGIWSQSALGVLVFAPVPLVWLGNPLPKLSLRKVIEGLLIFLGTLILEAILYFSEVNTDSTYTISFLIIPLIIWGAIRLESRGSVLVNFVTSLVFLLGVTRFEEFMLNGGPLSVVTILSIMATMLITSLIISASMSLLNQTQSDLSYLSTHDKLTGLYNRLFFETELDRLGNSRQFPISIIMVDVDNLKRINDTFGHAAGDRLLSAVADLFARIFRREDIVSRFGGDEFVILLPNADEEVAKKTIERINREIGEYNKQHLDLPINISMGSSTASQGDSLTEHLKQADQTMYDVKHKKNRVAE